MYPRGGQNTGAGGTAMNMSTQNMNTGVMPSSTGPVNNTTKTATDYTGNYGNNYGTNPSLNKQ